MNDTQRIAVASREDRAYLLAVAHRIVGDAAEAEDVVQDAFARLTVQDVGKIRDLRGWLVVVVRRLALDRIGSAHGRLSEPRDPAAADLDAAADTPDPADRVTLDDEIRRALSVVLDRLTPGERAVFLLHDVFGIPFGTVAEMVGRTPAACRKLASRARRAIRESGPTPDGPPRADPELRGVVDGFVAACAGGDLDALTRLLHPDVSGWATLRGERVGADAGAARVAAGSLRYLGPGSGWRLAPLMLDDGVAVVATQDGDPVALIRLLVADGLVAAIHTVLLR
ncbi:sigma-70 family RNA polymerase sigma factor [Myceligenerans pegani]|nr:sigma-70 family RNA polymerase sigma factor [Myceligenerans sp. TRM 65318]